MFPQGVNRHTHEIQTAKLWRWLTSRSTEKWSFRWNVWKLVVYWKSIWLFLARLSRSLIWWAYRIGRSPSSVVLAVRRSLNSFSSESTGQIKVKFHMELLLDGGTLVCSNGPGHMTNMATMPIYGKKKLKHPLLWNQKADDHETLLYASLSARVLPSLLKWWPWVDLDLFSRRSNLVPYAFVWEKGKTMDFSETIVIYYLKLATDDRSDKKFLLTSKLCPLGAVCLLSWGYIHVKKSWKKKKKQIV